MFNLFEKPDKGSSTPTPPNQTKAMLLATRRIANLTDAYVYSEAARQDVVKAVLAKRPRSYGEINSPMNKYSYLFSYFAHFCSILLALPFIAHFLGVFVGLVGYPTPPAQLMYFVAAFLLFTFEVGQSKTLNQTFDNYYNDGNYPIEAATVAALFSLFSVVSSGFSAYYFLQDRPDFIWVGVGLSLLMETLIIYCNFFRHRYQYKTRLEAEMLNDFSHNTNSNALFETFKKQPEQAPTIPINYNQNRQLIQPEKRKKRKKRKQKKVREQNAKVEIQKGAKKEAVEILTPSEFEVKKYGENKSKGFSLFKQQTNSIVPTETAPISQNKMVSTKPPKTLKTPVLTTLKGDNRERWTLSQIENNIKSYEGKIVKYGKSFARVANLAFFKQYKKRFKAENKAGSMPKIEATDRKHWYLENYPEQAAKLKAADKKKKSKK